MRRSLSNDEELVPLSKRMVLAFSCTRGSCFARARFERAFLGLLSFVSSEARSNLSQGSMVFLTFAAAS